MRIQTTVLVIALVLATSPQLVGQTDRRPAPVAAAAGTAQPRMPPLPESEWTAEHRALLATYVREGRAGNDLRTFLRHPELVKGVMPFASYVLGESTLRARDRELLILRTAWLCQSAPLWANHTSAATNAGITREELARLARGPEAPGWSPFEASLLRAADELHTGSFVTTATWNNLAARYGTEQLMDAVFTVAELTMLSMTFNSVGLQPEAGVATPLPSGVRRAPHESRSHQPLDRPRIPPLEPTEWTPAVRAMLDPTGAGREIAAVYRTFAQHRSLYPPRQVLSEYIRLKATIPARTREILILRIGYLCQSEYEWGAHARAGRQAGLSDTEIRRLAQPGYAGWNAIDATLVRAVDELYAGDTLSAETWMALAGQFNEQQLLDVLITTGGYRMVSMALNTFGVPLEANGERFPN